MPSPEMRVKQLFVYPVKSFQGIELDEAQVDSFGFANDRIYMVAMPHGEEGHYKMLTQREFASMALVECVLSKSYLTVTHKVAQISLRLPLGAAATELCQSKHTRRGKIEIWGQIAGVYDIGEVTGFKQFWSAAFDNEKFKHATLLAPIPSERRDVKEYFLDHHFKEFDRPVRSSFQDIYPGHLIATASLRDLNANLASEPGKVEVTSRNFRPNMVVETNEPFEEDFWDTFCVGPITWCTSQLCPRCPIPLIDPDTATPNKFRQPNKLMAKSRKHEPRWPNAPAFGISVSNVQSTGVIKVGDPVSVKSTLSRY